MYLRGPVSLMGSWLARITVLSSITTDRQAEGYTENAAPCQTPCAHSHVACKTQTFSTLARVLLIQNFENCSSKERDLLAPLPELNNSVHSNRFLTENESTLASRRTQGCIGMFWHQGWHCSKNHFVRFQTQALSSSAQKLCNLRSNYTEDTSKWSHVDSQAQQWQGLWYCQSPFCRLPCWTVKAFAKHLAQSNYKSKYQTSLRKFQLMKTWNIGC